MMSLRRKMETHVRDVSIKLQIASILSLISHFGPTVIIFSWRCLLMFSKHFPHRSHSHRTCSCLDNLCLLRLPWVVNSVSHWSHAYAKETGSLHVFSMYVSSSSFTSDDSLSQWLQVSDSSSEPGSLCDFSGWLPIKNVFPHILHLGSNAGF